MIEFYVLIECYVLQDNLKKTHERERKRERERVSSFGKLWEAFS
jgi:hypothetical protein